MREKTHPRTYLVRSRRPNNPNSLDSKSSPNNNPTSTDSSVQSIPTALHKKAAQPSQTIPDRSPSLAGYLTQAS